MAKNGAFGPCPIVFSVIVILVILVQFSLAVRISTENSDRAGVRSKVASTISGRVSRASSSSAKIALQDDDIFKVIAPKGELFGFRTTFFLPLRERLHQLKTNQREHFASNSEPEIKKEAQELIDSAEETDNPEESDTKRVVQYKKQQANEDCSDSVEDQDEVSSNRDEKGDSGESAPEFVPTKLHAQTRFTDKVTLYPYPYLEDPRLRENIIVDKGHTVYSEEGYEDLSYDHKDQEKNKENDESFANVKHRSPPRHRTKRTIEPLQEIKEIDPEEVIKTSTRGKSLENLSQKYPYYNMQRYKSSPMRYSENTQNIPNKTLGGTEFYDSRTLKCDEGELEVPSNSPVKLANNRRRKNNLGDEINCLEEKYFGSNPFDSPFFTDGKIEQPTSPFIVKRDVSQTSNVNAVIPEVILQRAASDPQLKVYFGVMETIKAALDDYDDTDDEFLKSNKKASIFQALARRPRSKYIEANAEMPLADEDLLTDENQNAPFTGNGKQDLWHARKPYTISKSDLSDHPMLSKEDYNRLLASIKELLKHQIRNLTRNKLTENNRRNDVILNHKYYDNHKSEYSEIASTTPVPDQLSKNIVNGQDENISNENDDQLNNINKKRGIVFIRNITTPSPVETSAPKHLEANVNSEEHLNLSTEKNVTPRSNEESLHKRSKYTLITKNESILHEESTEIQNDNKEKNKTTQKHEIHNVEHHANSRIDKFPTIIKDPLKRKYYFAEV